MSLTQIEQITQALGFIHNRYQGKPFVGIVLGSGLGNLSSEIRVEAQFAYDQIPHFPVSTVEGHQGKLILGEWNGKKIAALAGRFHLYEGYSLEQVVFPIRFLRFLGIKYLLISNAAGGINTSFRVGDLMVIKDHISFFTRNPLVGKNHPEFGPRFPDMSEPYKKELIQKTKKIAERLNIPLQEGVYGGVTGPSFETRAEYRFLQLAGCDAVGMSTVQEVIAAAHMGLPTLAVSVITDMGIRDEDNVITHEEVLEAAKKAEPRLTAIFKELVGEL